MMANCHSKRRFEALKAQLEEQFAEAETLTMIIRNKLPRVSFHG